VFFCLQKLLIVTHEYPFRFHPLRDSRQADG
jgi:hypothetical protein